MNRRSLVKGMALLPMAKVFETLPFSNPEGQPSLDLVPITELTVYVHGLFACVMNSQTQMMDVHLPCVNLPSHQHIYYAGSWMNPCISGSIETTNVTRQEKYTLELKRLRDNADCPRTFPSPQIPHSIWLPSSISPDLSNNFCSFSLWPTSSLALTNFGKRSDRNPIFQGSLVTRGSGLDKPAKTYIFKYSCGGEQFTATIKDKKGTIFWTPKDSKDHFHIFAEIGNLLLAGQEKHAVDAFDLLRAMVRNPDIHAFPFHVGDISFFGINECEDLSLAEKHSDLVVCNGTACDIAGTVANMRAAVKRAKEQMRKRKLGGRTPSAGGEVMNCVGIFVPS